MRLSDGRINQIQGYLNTMVTITENVDLNDITQFEIQLQALGMADAQQYLELMEIFRKLKSSLEARKERKEYGQSIEPWRRAPDSRFGGAAAPAEFPIAPVEHEK